MPHARIPAAGMKVYGVEPFTNAVTAHMKDLYERQEPGDFTIVTRTGEISCHRFVVMSHSRCIKKMIRLLDPPQNRIVLDNFPAHVVQMAVEYMYTGKILIEIEDIQDMVIVADYLQLDELKEWISDQADPFLLTNDLISWRTTAELIDLPRVAMTVKRLIIKKFDEFRKTQQMVELDGIEIGKFIVEYNIEVVPKDQLVDAALRWVNHQSNEDKLDWLTPEQLSDLVTLFASNWELDFDKNLSVSIQTRTYSDNECNPRLSIQVAIQRFEEKAIHPYLTKMAEIKAEKVANERAPKHLADPPRYTKYTLSSCFNMFKKAVKEDCEKRGEEIDDRMIEEKYDILMGNRNFRWAIGAKLLGLVQMKNCSIDYLKSLAPSLSEEFGKLLEESVEVRKVIDKARTYLENRFARAADWNQKSRLRLANIGGCSSRGRDQRGQCFVSYDGNTLETFMRLPNHIDIRTAVYCAVPQGFIAADSSGKGILYNTIEGVYDEIPPCPVLRKKFAMAYHNGRVYTISGMTGEWDWKNNAEYYDLEEKKWYELPDGPTDLMTDPSAVTLGKYIYVFSKANHLCRLDTETHEWESLKTLPDDVPTASCCTDGKRIWVLGGFRCLSYVYDPETDEWEQKQRPLFQHEYPGLCYHMGLIFLIGGNDCPFIEEYYPETNEWFESTLTLPDGIGQCQAMLIPVEEPYIGSDESAIRRDQNPMEYLRAREQFMKHFHRH